MNILFLSLASRLYSINDYGIYTDLLREFKKNGHNLYIVSPIEKRQGSKSEHYVEDGVEFLKVRIGNITKCNIIEKGISTILIERIFLKNILTYFKDIKFDLILYSTPPITFEKVIRKIKYRDNASTYLMLKDIFPQNAVDLDMFSKYSPIYFYFRFKEKKLYNVSDYIGCMSQENINFIVKNNPYLDRKKIEICYNSIEPVLFNKDEVEKLRVREKYKIPNNKIIFVYGGNLGKPQGIDFLINCIRENEKNNKSYILVVGSGTEYSKLEAYFKSEVPNNAKLLSSLNKCEYDSLVNACDVGLIFLDYRFTIPNFPSRLLSYMQSSMPVLAATDKNTDVGRVIYEGGFGFWCESTNEKDFNKYLNLLCDYELINKMGKNSKLYLEEFYTSNKTYKAIINHFENI